VNSADLRTIRDDDSAGSGDDHSCFDLCLCQVDVCHPGLRVDAVAADQGNICVHPGEHRDRGYI
jgi:hypothetical protein